MVTSTRVVKQSIARPQNETLMRTADVGNPAILSGPDIDKLLLIVDHSLKVCRRPHFYNWSQGALQSLLPHEVLVCAHWDRNAQQLQTDSFSSVPIPDKQRDYL